MAWVEKKSVRIDTPIFMSGMVGLWMIFIIFLIISSGFWFLGIPVLSIPLITRKKSTKLFFWKSKLTLAPHVL